MLSHFLFKIGGHALFNGGHQLPHALHVKRRLLLWFLSCALLYAPHGTRGSLVRLPGYIDILVAVFHGTFILPLLDHELLEPILHHVVAMPR